jgi:hypothetical protein
MKIKHCFVAFDKTITLLNAVGSGCLTHCTQEGHVCHIIQEEPQST